GFARNMKGEHDSAITDYDTAIKLDPSDPQAFTGRAAAWRAKGNQERAASDDNDAAATRIKYASDEENRKWLFRRASGQPEFYVIESDAGLFVSASEQYGRHLPYWHERAMAEQMRHLYGGPLPNRVVEIEPSEFLEQLIACRAAGMDHVLMDRQPDGSGRIV